MHPASLHCCRIKRERADIWEGSGEQVGRTIPTKKEKKKEKKNRNLGSYLEEGKKCHPNEFDGNRAPIKPSFLLRTSISRISDETDRIDWSEYNPLARISGLNV